MRKVHLAIIIVGIFFFQSCKTYENHIASETGNTTTYYGGKILTMEGDEPNYMEAVVAENDQILFTGTLKAAQRLYPSSVLRNLKGNTMMPGFIEPHVHPSLAGTILPNEIIAPYDWVLPSGTSRGATDENSFRERLTAALHENEDQNQIFIVWGYHQLWHGELSRKILNEIAGDRPVGIIHRSFHEFYINDAAFDFLNISREDFSGNTQIDWAKGHFYEGGWLALIPKISTSILNPVTLQKGLNLMAQVVHQNGITTIGEPGFPSSNFLGEYFLYKSLMDQAPPFDLYLIPNGTFLYNQHDGNEGALEFIKTLTTYNSNQLTFLPGQIKLFADGAIYSQLMQMEEGYTDGHHGEWMTSPEVLADQMSYFWEKEYKIHIHANGDMGIQQVLDITKPLLGRHKYDHRLTLHHMGYFTDDQAIQIKNLGVEASVNPFYLWALSDKYSTHGLGGERAENLVRVKSLVDRDIPVSFHSDFSMAPMEPLTLAWVAVNRKTSGEHAVSQEQRIEIYDALKAITIDAARTLNMEQRIGSIKVKKRANFVILALNPLEVEKSELKNVPIVSTIYKGKEFPLID